MNKKQILGGLELIASSFAMPLGVSMSAVSDPAGVPVTLASGIFWYDGLHRFLNGEGKIEQAVGYIKSKVFPKYYAASRQ